MKNKILIGVGILALMLFIPTINAIPLVDNMEIPTGVTTIDAGVYSIADAGSGGIMIINNSNVWLDMRHVWFNGSGSGIGINISNDADNVTIVGENATIWKYLYGIYVQNAFDVNAYGNATNMFNISYHSVDGVRIADLDGGRFSYMQLTNSTGSGLYGVISVDIKVYNSNITYNEDPSGIYFSSTTHDVIIDGNTFYENSAVAGQYDLWVNGVTGVVPYNITISNNIFKSLAGSLYGAYLNNTENVTFSSNTFWTDSQCAGFDTSDNVEVSDNVFYVPLTDGIWASQSSLDIKNNVINVPFGSGINIVNMLNPTYTNNLNITNNTIYSAGSDFIYVGGLPYDANISYNHVENGGSNGIVLYNLNGTSTVSHNTMIDTNRALALETSINISTVINDNWISDSTVGVYMDTGANTQADFQNGTIANNVTNSANIVVGGTLVLTNTTHNHDTFNIGGAADILTRWFIRVRAVDGSGTGINGANASLYNVNWTNSFSELTNATGYSSQYTINQDDQTAFTNTSYNNYTANATAVGYTLGTTNEEVDSSKTIVVTLGGGGLAPGGGGGTTPKVTATTNETAPLSLGGEVTTKWYIWVILGIIAIGLIVIFRKKILGKIKDIRG